MLVEKTIKVWKLSDENKQTIKDNAKKIKNFFATLGYDTCVDYFNDYCSSDSEFLNFMVCFLPFLEEERPYLSESEIADLITEIDLIIENVKSFNFADFDTLVSELVTERAKIRKENKEAIKAEKEAIKAVLAENGKAFYLGLKVGDAFTYKTVDGTIVHAKKIETKPGVYNSAACEVISGIEVGKSNKRYPKFHQVVIA